MFSFLTALFWLSIYKYFPAHFAFLRRRSAYYLYGDEQYPLFTLNSDALLSVFKSLIRVVKNLFDPKSKGDEAVGAVRDVAGKVVQTITSTTSAVFETPKVEL